MPNFPRWIALDAEVLRSPDSCRVCLLPQRDADVLCNGYQVPGGMAIPHVFTPLGWNSKADLGLSIGVFFDSADQRTHFFDEQNLVEVMQILVEQQPLIVTWNGASFDLPLMRGLLRRRAEENVRTALATTPVYDEDMYLPIQANLLGDHPLTHLCDTFKLLSAQGYDILQKIWEADPSSKRVKGLNGLGAVAMANGLGGKTGDGAQAPRDWAAGHYAKVIQYCQNDVYLTKTLFEMVLHGQPIKRADGSSLLLPRPVFAVE